MRYVVFTGFMVDQNMGFLGLYPGFGTRQPPVAGYTFTTQAAVRALPRGFRISVHY